MYFAADIRGSGGSVSVIKSGEVFVTTLPEGGELPHQLDGQKIEIHGRADGFDAVATAYVGLSDHTVEFRQNNLFKALQLAGGLVAVAVR